MPAEEPKYRNLYLNQRVAPVSSLIARAEWFGCLGQAEIADGEAIYIGLDLSNVHDLTALVAVSAEDGSRIMPMFWKPETALREHSKRDFGAGVMRYLEWRDAGHLLTSPGRTVDMEVVAAAIGELHRRFVIRGLAYDRWRMDVLRKEMDRCGLETFSDADGQGDGIRLVGWGQGFKDMAPAIDAMETGVIERSIVQPGNPVLTWNVANAVAVTDPAGNRKLDKAKVKFRIDGAVALTMALGLKARDAAQAGPSFDDVLGSISVW